jgi:DNA-binding CsgD family transcriptional regulator
VAVRTESPQHIAARVIPAIGRPDFPERLLSVYRDIADCDLCSAFSWDAENGPRLLFAAGLHPQIPGFALAASRAYAQTYWRFDSVARHGMIHGCTGLSLLRMSEADIHDADYRRDCYQRGGISERLTLFDTDSTILSVSGYRSLARGPITSEIAQRMEDAAPILVPALRRHNELLERAAHVVLVPSRGVLLQRAREWGLSAREAEVAAGLATGQSQADIAKSSGLALTSVITYRRRAYQKLKVADRLELRALCERMVAPAEP